MGAEEEDARELMTEEAVQKSLDEKSDSFPKSVSRGDLSQLLRLARNWDELRSLSERLEEPRWR